MERARPLSTGQIVRTRCDVLIVGGGPAGSTCAWQLRRAGLDVVVIDRATFPRDKPCAGWITPRVIDALELSVDDYRRERVFQPIHTFRTGVMNGRSVDTTFAEPVSFGICRREFDDYLLKRSGARVIDGTAVSAVERRGANWIVNGEIEAPMLVGAGGHFCPIAQRLGAQISDESIVAAQEIEITMTPEEAEACPVAPGLPELLFCDDVRGYGWIFRKQNVLNIGLGREDRHRLHAHAESFVADHVAPAAVPLPDRIRWKGHAYLVRPSSTRRIVDDGVLLIGDAAGLAYAYSGEGIRPAIESALLAVTTILEARGRYDAAHLSSYVERLEAHHPRAESTLTRLLPSRLKARLARWLLDQPWFARRVVIESWFLGT